MTERDTAALVAALSQQLQAHADRKGEHHATCPFCGKPAKARQTHFSFSERGYKCFCCDAQGGLFLLAKHLGADTRDVIYTPPAPIIEERYPWQDNADEIADDFAAHHDRIALWQTYKALDRATIQRHGLGVGVLPMCSCKHPRLIYPIAIDGRVVALRGRSYRCECEKWMSARGSKAQLWGRDQLLASKTPQVVVLLENAIDAMWLMQEQPQYIVCAGSAGAGTWKSEWTDVLVMARPRAIIIAFDADMAGCPTRSQMSEAREEAAKRLSMPLAAVQVRQPGGHALCDKLRKAGLTVECIEWPEGTPKGYDVGALLASGGVL